MELTEDGQLHFKAFILVAYKGMFGHAFFWQSDRKAAPTGSIEGDGIIEVIAQEIATQLPTALEAFANGLPEQ